MHKEGVGSFVHVTLCTSTQSPREGSKRIIAWWLLLLQWHGGY